MAGVGHGRCLSAELMSLAPYQYLNRTYSMPRTRISAATRRPSRIAVEQLEDRSVPATFSFAGVTFEQLSTPDVRTLLPVGTYDAAVVTSLPTVATGSVAFPDPPTTGFNPALALGALIDASNGPRALNLPNGDNGATQRSGVELCWSGGRGLTNATGDDLVVYESGSALTPEAFMIQVHNATTNTWSSWYYEPADSFAPYGGTGTAGAFATAYDLSALGVGATDTIDRVRIVNMTDEDRMVSSNGVGQVIPEDNGATSTFLPAPGPLASFANYGSATLDPDPLYVGAINALTNPLVDVTVTKTDNATSVNAGASVTYTIVVSNAGANAAANTTFTDNIPAALTNVSWTVSSTASGAAAGTGNTINQTLNLAAGASVTYTVTGTLSASASGTLSNTATATVSTAVTDTNPGNNSATDTDAVVSQVDVSVTKTDGTTVVAAGQQVQYTVVVSNSGPTTATGATFVDNFPAGLTNVTWTSTASGGATGNTASSSGNINETLNLPAGSSVTYTVTGTVAASAALGSTVTNTATAGAPGGTTDTNPGNNSATDTDTVVPMVDLSVTKTDGQTSVSAGQTVTYTIVASNVGATAVNGAVLTDSFPAGLTGVSWTSTASGGATGNTASSSGNINETLNLPVGSSVTYTVTATVAASAAGGTVSNTATIATPSGTTDNATANNSATDTDTVAALPTVDLSITKTDNLKFAVNGGTVTYTIVVTNVGSATVTGRRWPTPCRPS